MWKRKRSLVALAVIVLLVTAACSSSTAPSVTDTAPSSITETVPDDDHATEEASPVAPSGNADRVVEVELSEFEIAGDELRFSPGETIEFIITNSGVAEHEFRLSNQDRVDAHIAGGHADHNDSDMGEEEMATMADEEADHDDEADHSHDDDEAPHDDEAADHDDETPNDHEQADHADEALHADEAGDIVLVLAAGEAGTLMFTFPSNEHDYTAAVCLLPGHYEAGMATDLSYQT